MYIAQFYVVLVIQAVFVSAATSSGVFLPARMSWVEARMVDQSLKVV